MSKQIVEDENTANDLNQALKGAVEERDEVNNQEHTVDTASADLSNESKNSARTSNNEFNEETNVDKNDAQDHIDFNQIDNDEHKPIGCFFNANPTLRIAVHGMSELVNSRLSAEALDICVELLEAGVPPRALSEVVLHILDVKVKNYEREHGPILP
ncbi:PREDICTED: uncharacterized protein LOC108621162 [Drosophila arizonae]|uniref:Uncharacterized protein LOC108621162 n=1 Tax=Drosophila arizonae TaxID=7263 RepID=A0ABM1Q2X6_DROAR|nr:PREDICTED: uncharacterized protein LOC108621162 [Drosophila arizonae]